MNAVERGLPRLTRVDYDPFADGELSRVVPTTEPQREIWLADRLQPESSLACNQSVSLRLHGPLDRAALVHALADLMARHEALRASLGADGETLCIRRDAACPLEDRDLSHLPGEAREEALAQCQRELVDLPFDLVRDSLLRAGLVRLGADEHVLVLCAHHVVCDGWSWMLVVRDLGALYGQRAGQGDARLPAPESFSDYALAQAGAAARGRRRHDEDWWAERFADEVPVLELPTDHPRPNVRRFDSDRVDHVLDAALTDALRRLGARRGASLFATLLSGLSTLLARITAQSRLVIGIPAAGQPVDGHARLVGHCVSTLPLRFDVDPAQPFEHAIDAAHGVLLDALEHRRCTLASLLQRLPIARDPGRLPLISVMFNFEQGLQDAGRLFPGLALEWHNTPRRYDNFELSLSAALVEGELRIECQYASTLFDRATVAGWLEAFETLLRAAVAEPAAQLARLPLVSDQAFAALAALQPAPLPFDRECLAHEHFERQCDRAPGRIAISHGGQSWSYARLEDRANRIAHLLRRHGVRRGALVGLAMDRGPDMAATLLGVQKAGAGYVPLDPKFPPDRLAYMAQDAGLAALLTQAAHADRFDLDGRPVLALDALESELALLPGTRLARDADAATPESTAYVLYTSGSTGKPKGVQVPHRAVANLLASMQREPGIDADDCWLAVTTLSFDISVVEMLLPLSVGARIVVADRDLVADGFALKVLLAESGATIMQATPATWRLLLEAGWEGRPGLKILCGGEPMQPDLAAALLERCGQLWNLYGPTETTVYSTGTRVLPAGAGRAWPDIHIGRPVANTQVWILDEHGQLCPRGVPGEIHIGGEGVALGYLGRPDLTAERFQPDPWAGRRPGFGTGIDAPLLYRTGDRGRWRTDGNIEHMGRLDFQVKVRGYRIELGEIENSLATHPAVARAVAMAREDRPGDVRLVAYVVAAGDTGVDPAALATYLRGLLPDYMVPQHIVVLDRIPLLPNGKVDRKSLPAPVPAQPVQPVAPAAVAPAADVPAPGVDPAAARIAALMAEVLGVPAVAPDADFFTIGGHSLLGARLMSRLGRELGRVLPLRLLFEAPTAVRLAAAVQATPAAVADAQQAPAGVPRRARQDIAPQSPMQQRLWMLEQMQPELAVAHTSIPSLHRLRGPMDVAALERAFAEMVRRQPVLRTQLEAGDAHPIQRVRDDIAFAGLPVEDVSALPDAERRAAVRARIDELILEPIPSDRAPLFRVRLFRLAADDHVLLFNVHHAIWDGGSFDLLCEELSTLYADFCAGREPSLPALQASYGDYAQWYVDRLEGDALKAQREYWIERLSGALEPLHLPEDRPRPPQPTGAGGTTFMHLDGARVDALRQTASRANASVFMLLLTTYCVLLHRLSGQTDLVVGLPVRGQTEGGLDRVMGYFANVLPIRVQLDPAETFLQALARVRAAVLDCFAHPDMPLEQLVRELGLPRDISRTPVYQAIFSLQDVRQRPRRWGALAYEHIVPAHLTAPTDLAFWLFEDADGIHGDLNYNADIIAAGSAGRMRDRYVGLLDAFGAAPETAIGDAGLLCAADREQLAQWNSTVVRFAASTGVHRLLSTQAARTPARVAVRCGADCVDYATLDARSARFGAALAARGVRPGDRVGVCLGRHLDMVVAMLGVWKAGAAYVPLDPAYPAERLRFMAEDAGLRLVVTEATLADALAWPSERLLRMDADAAAIEATPLPADVAGVEVEGQAAAYVIYTSGSTGKPKGVCVPHCAVVNFLDSMRREPGLAEDDVLLAVTTTSFDISVLELFLPLSTGATIVLASHDQAVDGQELASLIERESVTVLQATPSTWHLLLDAGWHAPARFKALCGGEPMSVELAGRLLKAGVELWNMYGPTETTVWSTCARIEAPSGAAPDLHVGRPIANTTVWILDPRGQVCPPGVSGELCIGGAGVTLGYLGRDELTAEKFVPDRVAPIDHGTGLPPRLYRTGDRARWRPDGVIEHLGRMDFQVKLRGHRIELGEIEAVAEAQPGVSRAVAVVREDVPGDQRLVVYLARAGAGPDLAGLQSAMRRTLPAYMLPQHVVPMDALPLLPNGKVDRKSLPVPTQAAQAEPGKGAARRHADPRVQYLVDAWTGLLGVEPDPQDNFFELGGHSMLAAKFASRVAQETGHRIRLMPLATQTLAHLAAEIPLQSLPGAAAGQAQAAPVQAPAADMVRGERALYFGREPRRLFGMHHAAADASAHGRALLVPAPLLQEGVVLQRALWTVCDVLAAAGRQALRFDWYGSGESAGDSAELTLEGMRDDLAQARAYIGADARILAVRSASLLVLHDAVARGEAVDLVLWDPWLSGTQLIATWRRQHRVQLTAAGRYLRAGRAPADDDELLGFDLAPGLAAALEALDFRDVALPAGSRVTLVTWPGAAQDADAFAAAQGRAGLRVERVVLQASDMPDWDDAFRFEAQVFPRRSVAEVAALVQEMPA